MQLRASTSLTALIACLALAACAEPADDSQPLVIIPDEDMPAPAPDLDDVNDDDMRDPDASSAPDMDAPDLRPEDMPDTPDMGAPDMEPTPDMAPEADNPCASGLTDQERVDAWLDERISPEYYQLATREVSGTISNSAVSITFDNYHLKVTRKADNSALLDCEIATGGSISPNPPPTCRMTCTGELGQALTTSLTSRANTARTQVCAFTGVGVEWPALSFAVSHLDYESWIWTIDLEAERIRHAARSVGTVFIKYFEHKGQCLRLWHTEAKLVGSPIIPVVDGPRFKMIDIRQGLYLPRLDADVSEDEFFQAAASRVDVN